MVDNLTVALQFQAEGIPKTVGDVQRITAQIEEIRRQNELAARSARILTDAYELTADEAAQVQRSIAAAAAAQERASQSAAEEAKRARQEFQATVAVVSAGLAAGIGAFISNSVRDFSRFDGAIRQAGVISGASEEEIAGLREEIERLGIVTSATPQAISETSVALSRAGFTADQQTEAFEGIVRASEASGTALANVGETIGTVIRTFGLASSEAETVADVLVAATNNTNTSVETLSESLKFIGPAAASANQSIEDTAILLGLLGDQGIQGSQAGTNLAAALQRLRTASAATESELSSLVRGSANQARAFEQIQVAVRDTDGSMRSLVDLIPEIRESLDGLSQQDQDILIKALFGVEGGRAFQALLNTSQERIDSVTESVRRSQDAATEGGEALLIGLAGALNLFEGSLSATSNQFGEFLSAGVEPVIRGATLLLNTFLRLPAPIQGVIISTTALTGALAAAVAAVTAFNLANGQRIVQTGLSTAASIRNTAATTANAAAIQAAAVAQATYATLTGRATVAQAAQTAALAGAAIQLAAIAGAAASVALAVNTFRSITTEADELRQSATDVREALDAIDGTDAGEEVAQNIEEVTSSLGGLEQGLDRIRSLIPGLATAAEASSNQITIAFREIASAAADTRLAAAEVAVALENGLTVDEGQVERTVSAIDASIDALRSASPVLEQDIQLRDAQVEALEAYRDRITGTTRGVVELTDATDGLNTRLEDLNATLESGQLAIQQAGTSALAALEEQRAAGEVSAEEYQARLAKIEEAGFADRINLAKQKLIELRQLEAAATDPDTIGQLQAEILATQEIIDKDRIESAKTRVQELERLEKEEEEAAKRAAKEKRDAAIEAAEQETAALRQAREEQERISTEQFETTARQEQQRFEDQQRQTERQFQSQLQSSEANFQAGQQAAEQRFQTQLQSSEEAFNRRQRDEEQRFQDQLSEARREGNAEFDALEREVQNRIDLAEADTREAREAVRDRIEAEEEAARIRRDVEADVLRQRNSVIDDEDTELSPLEQARADFEAGLRAQEQEFQEQQRIEAQEFENAQEARQAAFDTEQRLVQEQFEEGQRLAQETFADQQRELERAFAEQQRADEAAFNDQQRQLNEASADRIANILATARATGQSLRSGGVAEGGLVQVHQDEFLIPPRGTRVVSQAESRRLIGSYLASVGQRGGVVASASTDVSGIEKKLDRLIRLTEKGGRPKISAGGNTFNISGEAEPTAAAQRLILQQLSSLAGGG